MRIVPRNPAKLAVVLVTVALSATAGTAAAESGGAQYGAGGTGGVQYGVAPGEVGSEALHARPGALLGGLVRFSGTAAPGARVSVQRLDPHAGQWLTEATAQADADGAYVASWKADHIGVFSVRALPADGQARAAGALASMRLTVYKPALATWYGPGFYGRRTACGQRLTRNLIGVAHRGLPCGRSVALYYQGRTLTARVVDRGPYGVPSAAYDLTSAAARALGFTHTARVGAVSLSTRK